MKRILVAIMIGGLAIVLEACTPVSSDPAAPYYPTYTAIAQGLIDLANTATAQSALPTFTPIPPLTGSLTYINEAYGFAFDYPPGWEVIETIVPKGTRYVQLSNGRYAVGSDKYDVLVIDVVSGPDWTLEINAIMKPDPAECCGGQGPVPYPYDNMYQPLEILARSAARHRPEDGYAWIVPEPHEPYPVLVMFFKGAEECKQDWPDAFIPEGEVVFLWDLYDGQRQVSLNIEYLSNQFTEANLQNRTIDYEVLWAMDDIVQSLRWLDN